MIYLMTLKMMNISQRYVQDIEKSYSYIWDILLDFMSSIVNFGNRNIYTCTFFSTLRLKLMDITTDICDRILLNVSYCTALSNSIDLYYFSDLFPFFKINFLIQLAATLEKAVLHAFVVSMRFLKYIIDNKLFSTCHIFSIHQLCDLGQLFWVWVPLRQANISCAASCSKI